MMNTKATKRAYWAKHVEDWKASGDSQSRYCRQHDLKPYQLTYWVQAFKMSPHATRSKGSKGFVSVQIPTPTSHTPGLTIRLPNSIRLEGVSAGNLSVVREIIGWPS